MSRNGHRPIRRPLGIVSDTLANLLNIKGNC